MALTVISAIGCAECHHVVINPIDPDDIFREHNIFHGFEVRPGELNIVRRMNFLTVDAVTGDVYSPFRGFTVVEALASIE